jgi:UDP-N-acetylglucosamine/UDP-N-acetylgalactosamine diphosphorylase
MIFLSLFLNLLLQFNKDYVMIERVNVMDYKNALKKLDKINQTHILRFFDELNETGKAKLLKQIEDLNLSHRNNKDDIIGTISPINVLTREETEVKRDIYDKIGIEALRRGQVAALMLAGGQGSRLGADIPKGAIDIGIKRPLYIFECLFRNLLAVTEKIGTYIPLCIMTGDENDEYTRKFLLDNNYFGYDPQYVHFFVQDSLPAEDKDGKILMSAKDSLAFVPNGHGGALSSLVCTGLLGRLENQGVKYINLFTVDNVLQRIADPLFIGALIEGGYDCGAKVLKRDDPQEKIGLICRKNGNAAVVEYHNADKTIFSTRKPNGELVHNFGVILNNIYSVDMIKSAVSEGKIEYRKSLKKVKYINNKGEFITPETENAYKYESSANDFISQKCLPFEVIRKEEFAPIKNKTGTDSIESARKMLSENGVDI